MKFNIHNTFTNELPADAESKNTRRQVFNAFYSYVLPKIPLHPERVHCATSLAEELGLTETEINSTEFLELFSGSKILANTNPYSMCYGGHQFGNWAGQLGDGRAINLFEIKHNHKLWAFQLKGAGETPYSRNGDGFAVLRSSIREHLCSEAMYYLGIPTTRSLSLILTGENVSRDLFYNGNSEFEKGAILCRVAESFIRFGNFQLFASRNDIINLKLLTDYTIKYFYPHILNTEKEAYLQFYKEVVSRTMKMVLEWQRVGFVHGVMNTDNMSILGLTIDYGPYGWMENYDENWTPNTTDLPGRRYCFKNQPNIALWNLAQLGNALYPLIEDVSEMETILKNAQDEFASQFHKMITSKLGIQSEIETHVIADLLTLLQLVETDMTIFFRKLALVKKREDTPESIIDKIRESFYNEMDLTSEILLKWTKWFKHYLNILNQDANTDIDRSSTMNSLNPKYVLRNYMSQMAIDQAEKGDYALINEFYELLKKPYEEQPQYEKWFAKRPEWARNKAGCSMLSCSS